MPEDILGKSSERAYSFPDAASRQTTASVEYFFSCLKNLIGMSVPTRPRLSWGPTSVVKLSVVWCWLHLSESLPFSRATAPIIPAPASITKIRFDAGSTETIDGMKLFLESELAN